MRRITRSRARTLGIAVAVVGALALTGCAASVQQNGGATGSSSQEDRQLRVAVSAFPSSWDQDFVAFDPVALTMFKNVYPYLVDYGITEVDGASILDSETILPTWAESFETDDGQTWTLTIREDAVFPSGNPITADDVKWSKDRAFAAQANVAGVYAMIGLSSPDQVTVVDERTVRFEQEWPSAMSEQIQAISLFVYDSEVLQEHATDDDPWAQDWAAQNPSDGGYYTVSSVTPGQEILLEANPDYPADNASQIGSVLFTVVSDTASASLLLESGDVDVAMGLSASEIDDLEGIEGVDIISSPSNEILYMPMNTTSAPFDDVRVRQAIAYAIPYDDVIGSVYGGEARRPYSLVPIDMPGYTEEGFPYEQDLDASRELLAEAGAEDIEFDIVYASGVTEHEQIAVLVQAALAEVGISATPSPLDPATLGERRAARDIPFQIVSGQSWVNDVEYMAGSQFTTGAYLNYADYSSEVVDAALDSARTATDAEQRDELWAEVQEEFAADVPAIPLAQPNFRLPVADGVSGFVLPVDGLIRFNSFTIDDEG